MTTDPTETTSEASRRPTYRSLFANREFGVLIGVSACFGLALQFEVLGLSVLVFTRTGSPLLAAIAFSIGFLPQVVGGALLTSLAERLPRRSLIVAGLVARAVSGLAIGLMPGLPVPGSLGLVAVVATTAPVYSAASAGLLLDLLGGDTYVLGRSVLQVIGSATQVVGLGLGGVVLVLVAADRLVLAAGTSLLIAAAVARAGLRARPGRPSAPGGPGVLRTTVAGNGALLRDRAVRGLLLAQWLPVSFIAGAEALIVPWTASVHDAAAGASALLAALPAGMLISNVIIGRLSSTARRRVALPLAALTGVPLVALVLGPSLPVAAGMVGLTGAGLGYVLAVQQAFVDSLPPELRSQAFGLNATGLMGGQGLVPPVAGALAAVTGPGTAILVAGIAATVSALALRQPLTGSNEIRRRPPAAA